MAKKQHLNSYIPAEMVEEILVNLPVKSLLRFLSVSTTWRSMIFDPVFVQRFGRRAALPDRERIALLPRGRYSSLTKLPTCAAASTSPAAVNAAEVIVCPFSESPYALAFCHQLWLVTPLSRPQPPLYLWNPSMRSYKKLPHPSHVPRFDSTPFSFAYGLGYCEDDDYKILKIPRRRMGPSELYSLRRGSWREVPSSSREMEHEREKCVSVSGHLHWRSRDGDVIVAFDLNAEVFGEVALPKYAKLPVPKRVRLSVLRGMLCVTLDYEWAKLCEIWVMPDYGGAASWTKMFRIDCLHHDHPRPLYMYQNGEILVAACRRNVEALYVCKGEKRELHELIYSSTTRHRHHAIGHGFLYAQSLVQL